jgi:hypothetical protein
MPSGPSSPILQLPLLATAQAQKEVTHNEALVLIDALLGGVAVARTDPPPVAPLAGQLWIVGSAPTGAWLGNAHAIALWTDGGWRFCTVPQGFALRVGASGPVMLRTGSGWRAATVVPVTSGGTTIDSECRTTVALMRQALIDHGLISAT